MILLEKSKVYGRGKAEMFVAESSKSAFSSLQSREFSILQSSVSLCEETNLLFDTDYEITVISDYSACIRTENAYQYFFNSI